MEILVCYARNGSYHRLGRFATILAAARAARTLSRKLYRQWATRGADLLAVRVIIHGHDMISDVPWSGYESLGRLTYRQTQAQIEEWQVLFDRWQQEN